MKGCILIVAVFAIVTADNRVYAQSGNAIAEASLQGREHSNVYIAVINLKIENKGESDCWFIYSAIGNSLLNYDGKFKPENTIGGTGVCEVCEYSQGDSKIFVVSFFGEDAIRAVRVSGRSSIHFKELALEGSKPVRLVDIWSAKSVSVDGIALEKYIPFSIVSTKSAEITFRNVATKMRVIEWPVGSSGHPIKELKVVPAKRMVIPIE